MLNSLFNSLWDASLPLISTGILAALTWGVARFSAWSGVKIEEKHMLTLHSAIMTGIGYAKSRLTLGGAAASPEEVVLQAKAYVKSVGAPGALKALSVSDTGLEDMIAAKVENEKSATLLATAA